MTTVQLPDLSSVCHILPDTATAQNAVALFIFTIPMGTLSQDLFVNPIYRSLRNTIAKRCHCELTVFDGNNMVQRTHSSPTSARSRVRNANGNASLDGEISQTTTSLLINITNSHEQVLFARGNWLIQVNYLTEPSEHHLFLKLVNDFATRLNSSGGFKRGSGSPLISQGFKYTTLVAITHERLRHVLQYNNLPSLEQKPRNQQEEPKEQKVASSGESGQSSQPLETSQVQQQFIPFRNQSFPREWGEFPSMTQICPLEETRGLAPEATRPEGGKTPALVISQNPVKEDEGENIELHQGGDLIFEEARKLQKSNYKNGELSRHCFESFPSLLHQTDHNFNHQISEELSLSCPKCAKHLEALEAEEIAISGELPILFTQEVGGQCARTLEQEIEELEGLVELECR